MKCDNGWGPLPTCPGTYCGRTLTDDLTSDCGSCPRGMRRDDVDACSKCVDCNDVPALYDFFFLLFMAFASLVLNCFYVEYTNPKKSFRLSTLHLSALAETVAAALVTLLLFDPVGTLTLRSCRPTQLKDWYTMFHNPYNVSHDAAFHYETLHCTHERVYPLYSIVLIFYGFCLVFLLLFRPFVSSCFVAGKGRKCIYAALYFYPILIMIHAAAGGLIYFCYPYLTLIVSIVTIAVHLALRNERDRDREFKWLLFDSFANLRNFAIILAHWFAHAFGIAAILVARLESSESPASKPEPTLSQQFSDVVPYLPILVTVPVPTLFYFLTVKFTDPSALQ